VDRKASFVSSFLFDKFVRKHQRRKATANRYIQNENHTCHIYYILFFQIPNQLIGQIPTYSRWTDSMEMTISNEDQNNLNNDTSIFSIKIDLFGHSMILFKTNLNNYYGYCLTIFFKSKIRNIEQYT